MVDEPVPQHVDETDEPVAVAGDDPAEAVLGGLRDPVPFRRVEEPRLECSGVERVDLVVVEHEVVSLLVADHEHPGVIAQSGRIDHRLIDLEKNPRGGCSDRDLFREERSG